MKLAILLLALVATACGSGASCSCEGGYVCATGANGASVCANTSVTCGGIRGAQCPAGYSACVDDPRDECGPQGVDCGGLCAK
jgi:hypothetical protein